MGLAVIAFDYRSHGRSGSYFNKRGFIRSMEDLVDDALMVVSHMRKRARLANLPTFVLGESLGGHIALRTAHRLAPSVLLCGGAILLSPLVSVERITKRGLNRVLIHFLKQIAYWYPSASIVDSPKNPFPDVQSFWDADPLCRNEPPRACLAMASILSCERLMEELGEITCPLLVLHSERDVMVDPEGSKALFERVSSRDKTIRFPNDMFHVLTKEPGYEKILGEVLQWLDKRL